LPDPHTAEVATVQTIDVAVLEDTAQDSAPISTDVGLFSLAPVRVRVRVPVVEHAWTWDAAMDEPPQSSLLTRGPAEQKTPDVAGVHVSDLVESQGRTTEGEAEQAVILEVVPEISMVVAELMMVTAVALESM
jgi:hypothetical protein